MGQIAQGGCSTGLAKLLHNDGGRRGPHAGTSVLGVGRDAKNPQLSHLFEAVEMEALFPVILFRVGGNFPLGKLSAGLLELSLLFGEKPHRPIILSPPNDRKKQGVFALCVLRLLKRDDNRIGQGYNFYNGMTHGRGD